MIRIGDPTIRVTGKAKVTGAAKYRLRIRCAECRLWAHASQYYPQRSDCRHGHVGSHPRPGVLHVMTPDNAPKLPQAARRPYIRLRAACCQLLQDDEVHYNNQPIAVGGCRKHWTRPIYAASLITVRYQSVPGEIEF